MKKLLILTLILALCMSLLCFIPTIMADETATSNTPIRKDYDLQTNALNTPVYNGISYYINISKPEIFASLDGIIAVAQDDDVLVKMSNGTLHTLTGKAYYKDSTLTESLPLKSITIDKVDNYNGYIYLMYGKHPTYRTQIYSYKSISGSIESDDNMVMSFTSYLKKREITVSNDILNKLNKKTTDLCYVRKENVHIIYAVTLDGDILKIKDGSVTEVNIDEDNKYFINAAEGISVNANEDIFVYGIKGRKNEILKKSASKNTFESVGTYTDLVDVIAQGTYVYILEKNNIIIASKNFDETSGELKRLSTTEFKENCLSFDVNNIGENTYISLAREREDNITNYLVKFETGKAPSLIIDKHYGANCPCETPHQGWFDRPIKVATNSDNSTTYVVDKDGARLVILKKNHLSETYKQYFYNADKLLLSGIQDIEVDKLNRLYIASGDKIHVYNNNEKYDDKDKLPISNPEILSSFDGNIKEMKILSQSDSELYVLTDKNSIYRTTASSMKPEKIATLTDDVVSIYPSYNGSTVYVATKNNVSSYAVKGFDATKKVTSLDITDANITNLYVDYKGSIFISTDDNILRKYARNSDNTYYYSAIMRSVNRWKSLSDFYIANTTKDLYFVDTESHLVEIVDYAGFKDLYANDKDIYIDNNSYDTDLLFVGKTKAITKVYASPVNYEIYRYVPESEYFFILSTDKNNDNMYLVVDKDNRMVYIDKTALEQVESTKDCMYGSVLMPQFDSVKVYRYPFEDDVVNPSFDTTNSTMTLVHNVAYDGGKLVWQNDRIKWLKVSYYTDNIPQVGYVKVNEITSKTNITAPSTQIYLRVTTKAGGTAKMYDAADTDARVIADGIKNGTLVRLMQETFDEDATFTLVEIEVKDKKVVGYMLTQNLQENKFTTLQIVSIIITVLTVLITITVVVLVVTLKKKKDNINTFKNDKE